MNRFGKFPTLAAVLLVGAAILGTPTQARASFAISVYDDGVPSGVIITPITGTLWAFNAMTTDFQIGGSATIQLSGNGQLHVSYNDSVTTLTTGTHTLTLLVTETGYLLPPTTPVLLTSSGGGSYSGVNAGDTVVGNTLGFLDANNLQFGNGLGGTIAVAPVTGVVSPNSSSTPVSTTGTVTATGSSQPLIYTPGTASNIVPSSVPFSLTNVSYFTFTGSIGDVANISNSVDTATTATPAPAGLVLVLAGIPCLGVGTWFRRRRQSPIAVV